MARPDPAAVRPIMIDEPALIELAQALVRVRSVHEPSTGSTEAGAAAVVADAMRRFGWVPTIADVAPGRPNVVAVVEGSAGPGRTLMFVGHTDVVTEGDRAGWSFDPYGAEIRDGRLHGRGSADMKSGVAAMIMAVRSLELSGPFAGRVVVAAVADEEGLMLGSKALARGPYVQGVDGVIVGEPEGGEVCAVAKGAIRLRLELVGQMAHGAMPQHGRNPIAAAVDVLDAIRDVEHLLQEVHGEHRDLGWCHVTPTVVQSGDLDQINVIPGRCVIALDIRTVPAVDHEKLVAKIVTMTTQAAVPYGVEVVATVVDDRPPVDTPRDHPVVQALAAAHEAVVGKPAIFGGVPGATDGTILARDAGLATVVYGPGGKWIAHQADEYVEIDEMITCARVYAEAARRFLAT